MEDNNFSVELGKIVSEFKLEPVCVFDKYEKIKIITNEVNRPGLQIAGFFEYFYNNARDFLFKKIFKRFFSFFK